MAPSIVVPSLYSLARCCSTPFTASAPAPATAPQLAPSFGEEQLVRDTPRAEAEPVLHARVTALRAQPPETFVVTLDNGQAWRHDNARLAAFLREGDAVTITRAALGAYRLTRDAGDAKNWIRVTRIR